MQHNGFGAIACGRTADPEAEHRDAVPLPADPAPNTPFFKAAQECPCLEVEDPGLAGRAGETKQMGVFQQPVSGWRSTHQTMGSR